MRRTRTQRCARRAGACLAACFFILPLAAGGGLASDPAGTPHGDWRVVELRGVAVAGDVRTTMTISADGSVGGSGGCNRYGTGAEIADGRVAFGPVAATRMMCEPPVMEQERSFFDALATVDGWRVEDGALVLLDGADAVIRLARPDSAAITIPVPGAAEVTRTAVTYRCGDLTVEVEYVNAGPVSLALLTLGSEFVVAANVVAASGARYAGGRYVWWARGVNEALLQDITDGDDAPPTACSAP